MDHDNKNFGDDQIGIKIIAGLAGISVVCFVLAVLIKCFCYKKEKQMRTGPMTGDPRNLQQSSAPPVNEQSTHQGKNDPPPPYPGLPQQPSVGMAPAYLPPGPGPRPPVVVYIADRRRHWFSHRRFSPFHARQTAPSHLSPTCNFGDNSDYGFSHGSSSLFGDSRHGLNSGFTSGGFGSGLSHNSEFTSGSFGGGHGHNSGFTSSSFGSGLGHNSGFTCGSFGGGHGHSSGFTSGSFGSGLGHNSGFTSGLD